MYQELNNRSLRRTLLLGAASAAALSMTGAAFAQDSGKVETVVVTGSRIPTTNLTTTSPVTELSAEDIKTQGVSRIEDLVTQLPQAFAAQNSTVSNGSTGTATIDLYGLGSQRVLVLVDGLRLPYGSPIDPAADLNEIPTQMVERIDVLTGGAAAVYGSDAVAGVVNFVLKKNFEGFQIDAQYNVYQHNNDFNGPGAIRSQVDYRASTNPAQFKEPASSVMDGQGFQIGALLGVSSANGKGNVTAYFSYRNNQPVLQANRDYSACTIAAPNAASNVAHGLAANAFTCGGSSTSYPGRFTDFSTYNSTLGAGGTFTPFNPSLNQYNYGPLNYYQRPDERYTLGAISHYSVNSHVEVYSQLMFTDYHSLSQIAPSGDFGNTSTINCGNPLLSSQQLTTIGCTPAKIAANTSVPMYILRRNVEGGGRQSDLGYNSYRAVIGVRGDIAKGWSYDVSGQWSKVIYAENYINEFSVTRLTRALDVVQTPTGPQCQSVVDGTDKNCVPIDYFTGAGPSAAALKYVSVPLLSKGNTTLQNIIASVSGDLGQYGIVSPWAKSPVQVALGAEYRSNSLGFLPDLEFQTGDGAGQGGPTLPVGGTTNVTEGFTEIKAPLAEGLPGAQLVSLDLAYRYSSYNTGTTTSTWKIGADWAPIDDVRFRGSLSRAVRAANVIELYSAQSIGLFTDAQGDPCGLISKTSGGPHGTLAQCVATGVPAANYESSVLDSPANQYNQLGGGNPHLAPEKASTWTGGVVLTPTRFLPGFTGSVDYYFISVSNLIASTGDVNIFTACYTQSIAAECARIHRAANGNIWVATGGFVENTGSNIGFEHTSGVNVSAAYPLDLGDVGLKGDGNVVFTLQGNYVLNYKFNAGTPGAVTYDCNGLYDSNCGTPNPKWRHVFRTTWTMPWDDIGLTATWRYYSGVKDKSIAPTFVYSGTTYSNPDATLAAQSYLDLETAIPLPNNTTLRFGVNNVLDSDPPLARNGSNGNTYPQLYDALGRYVFAGITVNL